MIEMEMTEKKIYWLFMIWGDVSIKFIDAVASVEDENILIGFHKGAYRIPSIRIVPSVRAEKNHSQFQPPWDFQFFGRISFGDR